MACNLYDLTDTETGEVILRGVFGNDVAKAINERLPGSKMTAEKLGYYAQHGFKIRKRFMVDIVGTITTKHKIYTDEDNKGMIDLYNTGEAIAGVARKFGCSTQYIRKILKQNNVVIRSAAEHYRKRGRATEIMYPDKKIEDFGKLGTLAKAGWKVSAIAEEFGTNEQEVKKCLKALKKKSDFSCTTSI